MSGEMIFRVAAGTLCISLLPTLLYYRRNGRRAEEKSRPAEGWTIWILVRLFGSLALILLLASIIYPSWMMWARLEIPVWLRYGAGSVGAMAVLLLYWVFHTLGPSLSTDIGNRKGQRVVTDGPYRWVRHPLYSVGTLFWIALSLVLANWVLLLISLLIFLLIVRRTRTEEEELVKAFGQEYRAYGTLTGRFVPRFNLPGSLRLGSGKAG